MYPSGRWDGFWEQAGFGRQPMSAFALRFDGTAVDGEGTDVIGPFRVRGSCDPATGRVRLVKQYLGKHAVLYDGEPDGEGSVHGTWRIGEHGSGPFLLRAPRPPILPDDDF